MENTTYSSNDENVSTTENLTETFLNETAIEDTESDNATSSKTRSGGTENQDNVTTRYPSVDTSSKTLCVIGCTPYVRWSDDWSGRRKYEALVETMAQECDIMVHLGDTKAGGEECNEWSLTRAVHTLKNAATAAGKMALYTLGDNEVADCHRQASRRNNPVAGNIYRASDARNTLISNLRLQEATDLTGMFPVDNHNGTLLGNIPGTLLPYRCEFDKYYATNTYAVATLEVPGSYWYLDDERDTMPFQNYIDPLADRLSMYLNAKDCALDWISQSTEKASNAGLRAVFFMLHANFYNSDGTQAMDNGKVGETYGGTNLKDLVGITNPYDPLFDHIKAIALEYPALHFYVIHSDGHRSSHIRMFPNEVNSVAWNGQQTISSHQNVMAHQIEGASRGLTMYSKFTVDADSFQPVTWKEEWSESAYFTHPEGHTYKNY